MYVTPCMQNIEKIIAKYINILLRIFWAQNPNLATFEGGGGDF